MAKRLLNKKLFTLSCVFISVMNAAYAADESSSQAEVQLDEMVVTGSRTATKLSETPMAIGTVKNSALKRDKPKTIGEAINRIAGVTWVDLGNEQHMMGIRQPNSTNAVYQYLEDGVPIRPLGVFNHNSLNELNLAGTDHVEVVKGAASSLYGSNAVGGAVNFITAPSSQTPEASIGFRNEAVAGYQRLDTSASNTWDKFGMRFSHYSARRSANNWQQYSNGDKDSVTLRTDYALSGSSLLHSVLSYNNLDSATPGSLNPTDYQATPGKSYQTFSYRKDKTTRLSLVWEGETVKNGLTTATAFGRRNDHGQLPNYTISSCTVSAACPTGYRGTINNNHVSSLGLDVKHQQDFAWKSSRLIAGLYYDQSPNSYKSDILDVTRNPVSLVYTAYAPNTTYTTGVRDYKTDIKNIAMFTQFEMSPLDNVRVVIGGRNDSINYDFANNLTPSANFGAPNESRSFSHFSPKVGATYAMNDRASVYANISQGFTPPEVSALYGKSAIPSLKPSTYDNYELGMRMALLDGALKLDSAIYRLDGKDTIVSYTIAPGNSENRNAGRTRSSGLELGLAWGKDAVDARMGASISSHRFTQYQASAAAADNFTGKEMPSAPNTLTAEVGYKPIQNARIALEMVRQDGYWMNNANTVRYNGHTLFNLRGNYKFNGGWEAWLQGRNLLNERYSDSASSSYKSGVYTPATQDSYSSGAPTSFMVGVTYSFDGKK
jgi:outer membrane receptor protein involved in Fe transport